MPLTAPRGLYLVTRETADTAFLLDTVHAALDGGAVLVQYRDKSGDAAARMAQAVSLELLCARYRVPLIINDDVVLAGTLGVGVHLGRDDRAIEAVRHQLGPAAVIGASCYDSLELAAGAAASGASYLAFGSFFASPTKPHAPRATIPVLQAAAAFGLPRVAIGGITLDNAGPLVDAGADHLAVISAVFDAPDPRAAARAFTHLFEESAR